MNNDHFFKLLNIIYGTFDEVVIVLAGCCGLRRGEIFGLKWSNVDFKNNKLTIEKTKTKCEGKWIIKKTKNESSQRTINAPKIVFDVLRKYQVKTGMIQGFVCTEYKPDAYSKHYKKLLIDNNIPTIRLHDLRHFNAIIMMDLGIPDKVAAGRGGWSQVSTLQQIYQHATEDSDKAASEKLSVFFDTRQ